MRRQTLLLSCLLLAGAFAAYAVEPAPAPPPPPIDRNAPPRDAAAPPPDSTLPEKITLPPPPGDAPVVSIRSEENGDTVEEYRQNGQITMVKVRPARGVPYTLMDTNGDGRLDRSDSDAPVGPVYYTIYEWN